MRILLVILLSISMSELIGFITAERKLKLLHVLFRHGDKIPVKRTQYYPTDPHRNHSYYPVEDGGLTDIGKAREYNLGVKLREKYGKFLGPYHSEQLVYARSTSVSRTRMSLQQVLKGLFPPVNGYIRDPMTDFREFPAEYIHKSRDGLLFSKDCPKFLEEHQKFSEQDYSKKKVGKYHELMKYLTIHTNKTIKTPLDVAHLFNLLKEESAHNLTLPEWTIDVFPHPMKEVLKLNFDLFSNTTTLKRLNAGPLLRKITEDMKALKHGTLKPCGRKAFLYGVHEVNVAAMARSLNLTGLDIPDYSSAIVFETLQDEKCRYYVKVFVWTAETFDKEWKYQRISGCHHSGCRLEKFLQIRKDLIPTQKEADCWSHLNNNETLHH